MQGINRYMSPCPPSLSPNMSTTGLSNVNYLNRKPTHRRNDSGELDVFEAAKYFSGGDESIGFGGGIVSHQVMREERAAWRGDKKSLNMPMKSIAPPQTQRVEKQIKDKKCKQPSSPGGRLASFFSSFFHQATSKKKSKSTTTTTQSLKDDEESLGEKKRRSSISHSQSIRSSDSKSIYSSGTCSGFKTPTIVHKELSSNIPNNKYSGQRKSVTFYPQSEGWGDKKVMDMSWLSEKSKLNDGYFEKNKVLGNGHLERYGRIYGTGFLRGDVVCSTNGLVENKWVLNRNGDGFLKKDQIWVNGFMSKGRKSFRRTEEVEDDRKSDSSSDLFELKNYNLDAHSSNLPVYETTKMKSIKKTAIANVAF